MSNLCDSYLKQNENQRKNLLEDLKIIQSTGKSRKVGKVVSERIYNYINGI